jgi:leader peptidase (prepilin peptidase)/N-methyltransferase
MMGLLFFAFLGLAVGSFLSVCVDRLPEGASIISPPSHCEACGHRLGALDLIPLVSYIWLRGRCRYCGAAIGARSLAIELGTGLAFVLLWTRYDDAWQLCLAMAYVALLLVILFIDLEYHRIPNRLVYPGIALALLAVPFAPHHHPFEMLAGGLVGFGLLLIIAIVSAGGMGMGDVKLAGFIGVAVGFPEVLLTLFLAFVAGGVVAGTLLVTHLKGRRDPVAFGPFLAVAGMVSLLYGQILLGWIARR